MRIIVCGGRNYDDVTRLYRVLNDLHRECGIRAVIHGAASGADELAAEWASAHHIRTVGYTADWKGRGRSAGPERNQRMLDSESPDMVVAFPGGRGTADMVRRAKAAGVPVREITN